MTGYHEANGKKYHVQYIDETWLIAQVSSTFCNRIYEKKTEEEIKTLINSSDDTTKSSNNDIHAG
jgi:hypothetical protein